MDDFEAGNTIKRYNKMKNEQNFVDEIRTMRGPIVKLSEFALFTACRIEIFVKKLLVGLAVGINLLAYAESGWTNIDGVQWFYKIDNGEITLGGVYVYGDVYSNGTAIPKDTPGHLDIPAEIQGCPVRTIESQAFYQCDKLTEVIIPEGVANVGWGVFRECSSLSAVSIPSSVTNVSPPLFFNSWPKQMTIPQNVIDRTLKEVGCASVTNIQFSSAITNIGDYAFSMCSGLTSVTIPYGTKGIGARAFEQCTSMKNITIPNSVERIGNYAFIYCRSLTNVVVPQSVTNIAANAFWGCSRLETTYIPLHLRGTFDERTVFGDCSPSLRIVYYASEIMPDVRSYEGAYDGLGHGIDVRLSEELLSPSEIKFSLSEAGPYFDDSILFTNVTDEAEKVWYTISAEGYETITNFATVKIMPRELLDEMVVIEEVDQVYDATPKEPRVFVQDGELSALSVQDYEVAYSNNVSGGFASVVVSGKRNYRGKVLKHFAIRLMVTFDANGGEGGVTNKQDYGSEIVVPNVSRLGYMCDGWEPEVAGTVPVSNVTYIAQWRPNQYNVTFDANGGTGVMDEQLFVYDEEQTLSPLSFAFADHRFVGWTREPEGEIVYADKEVVSNLTAEAGGTVTLHAAWEVWTTPMQICDDAFGGAGVVSLDEDDNIVVTLTNDVSGTVEIPDYVGAVTIDLNGHDIVGDSGPAIRVVKGDGDGDATRLAIVDTSEGEKGQISGGGESAGIEVAEDAATGVKLDVEESVGVFNGDGSEQDCRLLGGGSLPWTTDGAYNPLVANVYDGYILAADGSLAGVIQMKAAKQTVKSVTDKVAKVKTATTNVAVTATVTDAAGKKWPYKGVGTVDGVATGLVCTAKGVLVPSFGVSLGANGLEGEWGDFQVTGARNGMGVKGDAMTAMLDENYKKSWSVTLANEQGVTRLQLVVGAKGSTKISGVTPDGFKISATVQGIMGEDAFFVPYLAMLKNGKLTRPANLLLALGKDGTMDARTSNLGALKAGGPTVDEVEVLAYVESESSKGGEAYAGTVVLNDLAYPAKFAAKGLPAGLKIDAATGAITGTPTKPGHYTATITVTSGVNGKKKVETAVDFDIGNYTDDLIKVSDSYGDYCVGVMVQEPIAAAIGCTVSGLPAGLKFAAKETKDKTFGIVPAGTVYGVPTKAGEYTVYFKKSEKVNGKTVNHQASATFRVEPLPVWAQGTFDGCVYFPPSDPTNGVANTRDIGGTITLTAATAGKISASVKTAKKTYSFSMASWTKFAEGDAFTLEASAELKTGEVLEINATVRDGATVVFAKLSGGEFGDDGCVTMLVKDVYAKSGAKWIDEEAHGLMAKCAGTYQFGFDAVENEAAWTLRPVAKVEAAFLKVVLKDTGVATITGTLPDKTKVNLSAKATASAVDGSDKVEIKILSAAFSGKTITLPMEINMRNDGSFAEGRTNCGIIHSVKR